MRHGDTNYFTTISGRRFWPLDPRVEDIDIQDIAHALAHVCRFNGHVREFYSVAQHSVIVSHYVPREFALHGLLHDAAEAYIGDMSAPLKHDPNMVMYREADRQLTSLIYRRFGIRTKGLLASLDPVPLAVKMVDRLLIQDEIRDIALHVGVRQPHLQGPGLGYQIVPRTPAQARDLFLYRFEVLTNQIGAVA